MQQPGNFLAAAIKLARKRGCPSSGTPLMPTVGRSSGRTVHPGLAPAIVRQAFVRRSFRSFAGGAQRRWRSLANYEYSSTGRYNMVGCKLQHYADEGCKTCASADCWTLLQRRVLDASATIMWPWPLTFWPPNIISSSSFQDAPTTKVWRKSNNRYWT